MSKSKNQLAIAKEETLSNVHNRIAQIQQGGFKLPANYSPENALQSAWLMLQDVQTRDKKPVLEACSKNSIAMALFKMVQLGLNPAKNQCYFIAYGSDLQLSTSYFGQVLIAKRSGLKDVKANLIREGDDFDYQIEPDGRKTVTLHKQPFTNFNNKIIGAYCVVTLPDGTIDTDIMTMDEIKQSWKQGATNGNSPAHKNFEGEMAKRTVTNRAIKMFVNSSDDSAVIEDGPHMSPVEAHVNEQISQHANKQEFGFDDEEAEEAKEVKEESKPEPKPKPKSQPKNEEAENQRLFDEALSGEGQNKPNW